MKGRRIILVALAIILAFASIAASGSAGKSFRITAGKAADAAVGRSGVHFNSSHFSGTLTLTRKDPTGQYVDHSLTFVQKMLDARFTDLNGQKVTRVEGSQVVFFTLRRADAKLWSQGKMSIVYYDPWFHAWRPVPTYALKSTNGEIRVACRMRNFGAYALVLE